MVLKSKKYHQLINYYPGGICCCLVFQIILGICLWFVHGAEDAIVHARAAFVYPLPDETTELLKYIKRGEKVKLLETNTDSLERGEYEMQVTIKDLLSNKSAVETVSFELK